MKKLLALASPVVPEKDELIQRIRVMEQDIALPVKAVVMVVLAYYLFYSKWFGEVGTLREATLSMVRSFFVIYCLLNIGSAIMLLGKHQLKLSWLGLVVLVTALMDGLFLSALTVVTEGFESILYWVFVGLIVRNAISLPTTQIVLNLLFSGCYFLAGLVDVMVSQADEDLPENIAESFVLRLALLLLLSLSCYGIQVLLDKDKRAEEEAHEFALRQEQLQVIGRWAAEIAHQLKNPLGIINNAAFNLQRNLKDDKTTAAQQIKIIREEVERSDRIITDLMGYAKFADGRLERLSVAAELDRALEQVFPPAAHFEVEIHRDYAAVLPPLLMQKNHLAEILVNLLQNAREAMNGHGHLAIGAHGGDNYSVVVTVADDGPGIPADLQAKVFEPYFTTKPKGTGLGLAIVKHNLEIYGGTIRIESAPGRGTRFSVQFPAKSSMRIAR